jgi:hypothetical protein
MGGGGEGAAQRLVLRASKPKKTGTLRGQVCHSGLSEDVVYRVTLGLMCLYFKLNGPLKSVVELFFENRRHFRRSKQNLTIRAPNKATSYFRNQKRNASKQKVLS